VTANDLLDVDGGGNNRQNFPVLTSAASGGGTATIEGTLNSTPNTDFRLEFFANTTADPSNHGEGESFIGSTNVTTDGSGDVSFTNTFSAIVPVGEFISATATDPGGNTSEFSGSIDVVIGVIEVSVDIKPGSYPNCFNINGNGVIPVAILGSDDFDVTQIDVATLEFAGLDVRVKGNGTPQCSVEDVSGDFTFPEGAPDGYDDLVCQFVDDPNEWKPDNSTATLTGNLKAEYDGTPFHGTDEICIVP
jgi:hypothetical protein